MYRISHTIDRSRTARVALMLGLAAFGFAVLPLRPALAQSEVPAPPSPADARLGLPGEQSQPGADDLNAGRAAAMRGRWQDALDRFRAVLAEHPNGELADDATYWIAKSLEAVGEYELAVERVNEFIDRYPNSQLLRDARVVRLEAAEALVSRGNADYERYLRDEAGPQAPPAPPGLPGQPAAAPPPPDVESDLRLMALDALIGMDPESAWPILQRVVADSGSAELRARSVWLLSQVDTDEAFDLLVEMARSDPDSEVRGQALFWVGQSADHSEQAMGLLIDMLQSAGDEELLGQALFGLGQSSDPRARQALEGLARDTSKSAEMRGQALFWLAQQGDSLGMLGEIALNDPDEELRSQALFGIAQIESEEANEFLLQIARSDAPMEVRSNAIFWLGQRGDERVVDVLIGLWADVDDVEVRNQLLFALAQTNTEASVDHLVAVAKNEDEDPELRSQAVFWLGQSEHPKAKQALIEIIGGGVLAELER